MQYKMAELRRWSAEMDQKMRLIGVKLQRWINEGPMHCARSNMYRLQRNLEEAKFALMGMCIIRKVCRPTADILCGRPPSAAQP